MKNKIIFFIILVTINLYSQNKKQLYNFVDIPQTLLLNPGAETNYKLHVGIPVLSGISAEAGITSIKLANIFKDDGISINTKIENALDRLSTKDFVMLNNQVDIFNAGIKWGANYISFGAYTDLNVFVNLPKDLMQLALYGNNAYLNKSFSVSQLSVKADLVSVFHVGVSRQINEKFTIGGRLKLYSGVVSLQSIDNIGSFTTNLGQNSIYEHYLSGLNVAVNTSGFADDTEGDDVTKNLFNFSNPGFGIDLGFTYKLSDNQEITASIIDLGAVTYKKYIENYAIVGGYTFTGVDFLYDENNINYFRDLSEGIKDNIITQEDTNSFKVSRPTKFYGSYKYSWGRGRSEESCYDIGFKNYYNNAVGGQVFSVVTPLGLQTALTGFYERNFGKFLKTKFTYTVDAFSYSNLGFGFSSNLGAFNVYGMVDNVLGVADLSDTNTASVQLGFNLIFD